jgi:hypothetical protein
MRVRFFQVARHELDDAVEYYNRERPGLGYEFLWEVFFGIERIKQFPEAWQVFHEDARRDERTSVGGQEPRSLPCVDGDGLQLLYR